MISTCCLLLHRYNTADNLTSRQQTLPHKMSSSDKCCYQCRCCQAVLGPETCRWKHTGRRLLHG
jgi:hypothetical protein